MRGKGELLAVLLTEMDKFVAHAQDIPGVSRYLPHLLSNQRMIQSVTVRVIDRAGDNPEEIGAASYAYMELLGQAVPYRRRKQLRSLPGCRRRDQSHAR